LTIFEMLEKLETEIVFLRTRCQDLASSLERAHSDGAAQRAVAAAPKPITAPRKKSKKKPARAPGRRSKPKAATTARAANSQQQLELGAPDAARPGEEQTGRRVGKRQALGKSLVQLRKMSAWRTSQSDQSPET
jgi:hypothetical protein